MPYRKCLAATFHSNKKKRPYPFKSKDAFSFSISLTHES